IAFSALDDSVAADIETMYAKFGVAVITTASSHRMDQSVPLIVPEVNADHVSLVAAQGFPQGGMIIANPNSTSIGLTMVMKPLVNAFGVEKVAVTTYQAVSG